MGEIPRHLEQSERHDFGRKALIFCSIAAAALGTLFLLWYLLDLWLLMFAAILVSVLLHAPSQWLSDHTPLSHAWSLAAVVLAIAALLGIGGWLLAESITQQATQLSAQLPTSLDELRTRLMQSNWGATLVRWMQEFEFGEVRGSVVGRVTGVVSAAVGALADLGIVLILAIFMAAQPLAYQRTLLALVPTQHRPRAKDVLEAVGHT